MFYRARFYDPSLGRFAQADSIVPGGVQGLDRYAYVNNNALRYTDPTGHYCEGIQQGDAYNACMAAHYGTPKAPELTEKGKFMQQLYDDYRKVSGWWNADGDFTLEDFVGLWILFEGSGASIIETWIEQANLISTAVAQNLFVGGWNPARGVSINAVFNFMGSWRDGESGLGKGPDANRWYARDSGLADTQAFMKSLGKAALHPTNLNWDKNAAPSDWGNITGAKTLAEKYGIENGMGSSSKNDVYYRNGHFIIRSINQTNHWISLKVDMGKHTYEP
jgi:hypothetical protein